MLRSGDYGHTADTVEGALRHMSATSLSPSTTVSRSMHGDKPKGSELRSAMLGSALAPASIGRAAFT